jgi:hypothetical protein
MVSRESTDYSREKNEEKVITWEQKLVVLDLGCEWKRCSRSELVLLLPDTEKEVESVG